MTTYAKHLARNTIAIVLAADDYEPALIAAIARRESEFRVDARNDAAIKGWSTWREPRSGEPGGARVFDVCPRHREVWP